MGFSKVVPRLRGRDPALLIRRRWDVEITESSLDKIANGGERGAADFTDGR